MDSDFLAQFMAETLVHPGCKPLAPTPENSSEPSVRPEEHTSSTAIDRVVSNLAHELAQPLAAIAAFSQACLRLLQAESADQDEIKAALEQITAQAEHAGRFVRHLRDQVVSGTTLRIPVQLNAQIQDAVRLCRHRFQVQHVRLRLQLASSLPEVLADPVELEQVLLNLLHNALDALSEMPPAQCIITISSWREQGEVLVAISDTGGGLPRGMAERLFHFRETTKPNGLGIGLPLAQSIIEAHQGRLWAKPNAGRGTTFCLSLPFLAGN
jgi:two-component system sensor histidine kinase DctS